MWFRFLEVNEQVIPDNFQSADIKELKSPLQPSIELGILLYNT